MDSTRRCDYIRVTVRKETSTRAGTRDREREREMSGRPGENFGEQAFRGTERVPERGKAELTKPDPNE